MMVVEKYAPIVDSSLSRRQRGFQVNMGEWEVQEEERVKREGGCVGGGGGVPDLPYLDGVMAIY